MARIHHMTKILYLSIRGSYHVLVCVFEVGGAWTETVGNAGRNSRS